MKKNKAEDTTERRARTVKISDKMHRKVRVRSVIKNVPMQRYLDQALDFALQNEDKFIFA